MAKLSQKTTVFCDTALLSSTNTVGLHCKVWVLTAGCIRHIRSPSISPYPGKTACESSVLWREVVGRPRKESVMPTLEERVQRLEDIEDIRRLKIRYAQFCDAQYDPDGIASCFTDDAVWDGGSAFGVHQGKQAIRTFFAGVSKQITFALHYMIGMPSTSPRPVTRPAAPGTSSCRRP